MRAILTFVAIATFSVHTCTSQQSNFTKTLAQPKLVKLWETEAVLKDVESAIYDEKKKVFYVTSINGHWLKPNGKGFISKVALNGKIINHKWLEKIDGPTGTVLCKNKLFVADFNAVLEVDLHTSKIIKRHKVAGTERINDLTVSNDGTIYGTGTKSGQLFSLKDGNITVLKNDLNWPNGILYENGNVLIGLGDKTVRSYDLTTKTSKIIANEISNPDGIVAIGNGDYLVSSWEGMIHYVTKNGKKTLLLDTRKEKINAADISYIPALKMVLIPAMLQHKLIAYKLTDEN